MTKLMGALWGADLPSVLHAPATRAVLAGAGATRLQLNLDDHDVSGAMRIPTTEPPIGAVVSVWADDDAVGRVLQALVRIAADDGGRLALWEVTERRPLDPPEHWDGTRADALANVALLRRPADLTRGEWLRRWQVDHTPVAIETQGTFGYVQNTVVRALTTDAPPVAAIVEELFPMAAVTDMHAFYGSGGDDAELQARIERLMASVARIGADRDLDLVPTSRYLLDLTTSSPG